METPDHFQQMLSAAGDPFSFYSSFSFHSLLSFPDHKFLLLPSLDYLPYAFSTNSSTIPPPKTFTFFGDGFSISHGHQIADQKFTTIDFMADTKLKTPKLEDSPTDDFEFSRVSHEHCFDFFSEVSHPAIQYPSTGTFLQLPDLRSLEDFQNDFAESPLKRVRSFSPQPNDLDSIFPKKFQVSNFSTSPEVQAPSDPAKIRQALLARERRRRFSENVRRLQKLLPSNKKMDMGTTLEEAYKYVKFLQAQVSVLRDMPSNCAPDTFENQNPSYGDVFGGGLEKMDRNQLLQVLVNSPEVQAIMYSQGLCVYSIEQFTQRENP